VGAEREPGDEVVDAEAGGKQPTVAPVARERDRDVQLLIDTEIPMGIEAAKSVSPSEAATSSSAPKRKTKVGNRVGGCPRQPERAASLDHSSFSPRWTSRPTIAATTVTR
jgi:hypothetical protein